jgi:citronellol/citronellal dehydrogenase
MSSSSLQPKDSRIFQPDLLDGTVAVVTGGGTGIGRTTALELVALGADVVVSGRRIEPLIETAKLAGGRCEPVQCDIRVEADIDALVESVIAKYGHVDVLVNNAGGQYLSPAEEISRKGFRAVVRLNLEGTWMISHAVATQAMIPSGRGGKIISITAAPHTGLPSMAHSSAARAGVENLVRVLGTEWARFGIRVTGLALGNFVTDAFREKYPPSVVETAAQSVPLGRTGTPEEVAWMVAYLASPAGDFITGAVLNIDGGRDNWYGHWPPPEYVDPRGNVVKESRR